ncbi:MAG: hypothetical protein QNJ68_21915 [Microcoleaceae cyanobacterium MO_207.B10]|nr:hypothetical protein [Microcoleaceae cyanobacterium MO_207.B10]
MFPTNIVNLGFRVEGLGLRVWGVGCGDIIGKKKKKAGYQRDKVVKLY